MTEKISIGRIGKPFGIKGHLKVTSSGEVLGQIRFPKQILLSSHNSKIVKNILSCKYSKEKGNFKEYIVLLEGCNNPEDAEKLSGAEIMLDATDFPGKLKDEYYLFELKGLHPLFQDTIIKEYTLTDIMETNAHAILVFKAEEEILIPFLHEFVGKIDSQNNTIEIKNWDDWFAV